MPSKRSTARAEDCSLPPAADRSRHHGLADAIGRLEELALEGRNDDVPRELGALLTDFTPSRTETLPA